MAVPDGNVTVAMEITFQDAETASGDDFAATLSEFASLAYSIIDLFDGP